MRLFSEIIDTATNFSKDQYDTKKCPRPPTPTSQQVLKVNRPHKYKVYSPINPNGVPSLQILENIEPKKWPSPRNLKSES